MLLYHPYKDSNHCVFRTLSILWYFDQGISIEKLKILDFFYLFPHFLKEIDSWPKNLVKFRKKIIDIDSPFEKTPNKKKLFFDMDSIQNQALMQLASKGILSINSIKDGILILNKSRLPCELVEKMQIDEFNNSEIFKTLIDGVSEFPWSGEKGLKKRSGLMEYKYDE